MPTPTSVGAGTVEHCQQQAQHAQQALLPVEFCSTLLAMMTWNHLDSDLCQHVITLINRALDSPDGPHKGDRRCCAPRQRLVVALLDKGLMKTITDLQELVQESLFNVSCPCSVVKCSGVVHPAELSMLGAVSSCEP